MEIVEYSKVNVKLRNTQLEKLNTAVKNETGTTLRISLKILDGNDLHHELLPTRRKLRNAFNNKMSTDLYRGFLGSLLSKLTGPLMKLAIILAKNALATLGMTTAASAIGARIKKNIYLSNNNFNSF